MNKAKLTYLVICSITSLTLIGCATNNNPGNITVGNTNIKEVTDYNNAFVDATRECMQNFEEANNLYNDYKSGATSDIETAIHNSIIECTNAIEEINRIGNREGDSSLKDSIIPIIEKYISYHTQLNDILPLLEKGDNISQDENTQYNNMIENLNYIGQEIKDMNITLESVQNNFAKNHEYELESE